MMEFSLTPFEEKMADKFRKKHNKCLGLNRGDYVYSFKYTGIGIVCWIECETCGERKPITDVNAW